MSETPRTDRLYEPPRVEQVLTPEDLAREILYAGTDTSTDETTVPT